MVQLVSESVAWSEAREVDRHSIMQALQAMVMTWKDLELDCHMSCLTFN